MQKRWGISILLLFAITALLLTTACAVKPQAGAKAVQCGVAPQVEEPMLATGKMEPAARTSMDQEEMQRQALLQRQAQYRMDEENFVDEMIHFNFDSARILPGAAEILNNKVAFMKKYPEVKILIAGHTDERGTIPYNLALGERRAQAAKKYMADRGIDPARMRTISYGEERPLYPGHTEEAWAMNRRDEFKVQ